LFGIREREKKYKRKMYVVSNSSVWLKRKWKDRGETIFEMTKISLTKKTQNTINTNKN
jgi:hypothetical protein